MIFLKQTGCRFIRIIALCLVFSLTVPVAANAAAGETVTPLASNYLDLYDAYVCPVGNGKIEVWFEVMGADGMDELGALSIRLYESSDNTSWTWVKTFLPEDYSTMLAEDEAYHCSYVSYQGTAGKYYKAFVCLWAGKDGAGDSRYIWTSSKLAT